MFSGPYRLHFLKFGLFSKDSCNFNHIPKILGMLKKGLRKYCLLHAPQRKAKKVERQKQGIVLQNFQIHPPVVSGTYLFWVKSGQFPHKQQIAVQTLYLLASYSYSLFFCMWDGCFLLRKQRMSM